jgi:hypothetical protein
MPLLLRTTICRNGLLVRSIFRRGASSTTTSPSPVEAAKAASQQEVAALQNEIQSLRMLLAKNNRDYEGLSKEIKTHSVQMGAVIEEIHDKVALMAAPLERISSVTNVLFQNSRPLLNFVHQFERYSKGWVNKYSLGAILAATVTVWSYRATMYERTSEEVADIASRTLRQEGLQQSIQETLAALANSPETLDLLQKILRDPLTLEELLILVGNALGSQEVQKSLLSLLQVVLADPALQQQAGEFILKGLNIEPVKKMLDAQTQELVREVVLDNSVQQATALGVRQSLWYTVTPSYLWRRVREEKPADPYDDESN